MKKGMSTVVVIVLTAICLLMTSVACGEEYKFAGFVTGKTSYTEIVAHYGEPTDGPRYVKSDNHDYYRIVYTPQNICGVPSQLCIYFDHATSALEKIVITNRSGSVSSGDAVKLYEKALLSLYGNTSRESKSGQSIEFFGNIWDGTYDSKIYNYTEYTYRWNKIGATITYSYKYSHLRKGDTYEDIVITIEFDNTGVSHTDIPGWEPTPTPKPTNTPVPVNTNGL